MSNWYGIDVSDNQGVIDWGKVADAGCQFAILRSVRRSGKTDYQFVNNLLGCRANGIPVAVYKYTYAQTEAQAREEAASVTSLLAAHNLNCIVWWDVEDRSTLAPLGQAKLTDRIQAARNVIEGAGFPFGIYTGQNVLKEKWFDPATFSDIPWWVARYPLSGHGYSLQDIPEEKYMPQVSVKIAGWQWTSKGKIAGVKGNVDMNIMYQDPGASLETVSQMEYFTQPKTYRNGSTPEPVYSTSNADQKIGSLDPREECICIGTYHNMACVVYNLTGTTIKKTGWVKWLGGIQ